MSSIKHMMATQKETKVDWSAYNNGLTQKEFYDSNPEYRERRRAQWRAYNQKNKAYKAEQFKKHYQENKEDRIQKAKEWRLANEEKVLANRKKYNEEKRTGCGCGGSYLNIPSRRNQHFGSKKHQKYMENDGQRFDCRKIVCECGGSYQNIFSKKATHSKTKKHQKYLALPKNREG